MGNRQGKFPRGYSFAIAAGGLTSRAEAPGPAATSGKNGTGKRRSDDDESNTRH